MSLLPNNSVIHPTCVSHLLANKISINTLCHIRQCNHTSYTVGDYFIAELIEAQDDTHRTIVADVSVIAHSSPQDHLEQVDGRAVGFISLTTEVDLDLLNSCFDLAPYHGLCKPSDDDEVVSIEGVGQCNHHPLCVCVM